MIVPLVTWMTNVGSTRQWESDLPSRMSADGLLDSSSVLHQKHMDVVFHRGCTDPVAEYAMITKLIIHWPRDSACPDHVTDHALISWLSCTDHVAHHALITWLIMHWSRCVSCTDHMTVHELITWILYTDQVTDHVLITWLIMHWSRGYHALITWLIIHWSLDWSCTDHVSDHALLTWLIMSLIMHWSRACSCTWRVHDHSRDQWMIARLSVCKSFILKTMETMKYLEGYQIFGSEWDVMIRSVY